MTTPRADLIIESGRLWSGRQIEGDSVTIAGGRMLNLRKVLEAAGGTLGDIVQLIRLIVDQDSNRDAINRVMKSHLGDHGAASTLSRWFVSQPTHGLVLELQAIAMVTEGGA